MSLGIPILGLDLGTSTCLGCAIRDGRPQFIQPDRFYYPADYSGDLAYPEFIMPSVFAVHSQLGYRTGERALEQLRRDPKLGRDMVLGVKRDLVMEGHRVYHLGPSKEAFSPSRIVQQYAYVLRVAAEKQWKLGEGSITGAVVAVPTAFGSVERLATRKACEKAGLSRVEFLDEPVAAAYSLKLQEEAKRRLIMVVDLGGGTLDVTLLAVGKGVGEGGFDELGRDGDPRLGGLDWDHEIAAAIAHSQTLRPALPEDLLRDILRRDDDLNRRDDDDQALERAGLVRYIRQILSEAAEGGKKEFFEQFRGVSPKVRAQKLASPLELRASPSVGGDLSREIPGFPETIPTVKFPGPNYLKRTAPLVQRCLKICERVLKDASADTGQALTWNALDRVYLAGGGAFMASVVQAFADVLKDNPRVTEPSLADQPQQAVALGAALFAEEIRNGREVFHLNKKRCPREVGLLIDDGEGSKDFLTLVPRHAAIPFAEPPDAHPTRELPRGLERPAEDRRGREGRSREPFQARHVPPITPPTPPLGRRPAGVGHGLRRGPDRRRDRPGHPLGQPVRHDPRRHRPRPPGGPGGQRPRPPGRRSPPTLSPRTGPS